MRLDRQLTTAIFHPLQRAVGGNGGVRVPVLMYHNLVDGEEPGVSAYFKVNTAPRVFQQQINHLAATGWRTVTLEQVVAWLRGGPALPDKPVVITFDDGFRNLHTEALPLLSKHGFTATVFLPTQFIGDQPRVFKGTECLTWAEAREMRETGIRFGSHTVTHPELVRLSGAEIDRELRESKQEIEQRLGERITTFAYPYAFPQGNATFAADIRKRLQDAGYECCVTTELGRVKQNDDPFRLKRLPVNTLDDNALLQAKLDGGYDWLALPQKAVKRIKKGIRPGPRHAPMAAAAPAEALSK